MIRFHRFRDGGATRVAGRSAVGRGRRPARGRTGLLLGSALLGALASGACEAGPPAFERPARAEPTDAGATSGARTIPGDPAGQDNGSIRPDDDTRSAVDTPADGGSRDGSGSAGAASTAGAGGTPEVDTDPAAAANAVASGVSGSGVRPEVPTWGPGASRRVESWGTERFPYPGSMRGLYLNAWASGSSTRMEQLIEIARRTEINTFVIDIKDASGYVSHRTEVPFAHEVGATGELRIRDLPGLLARLEDEGIYPVARIVVVKDPVLVEARPDLAVQDTAGGVWIDRAGDTWLNPYDVTVWDYHLDLAKEVAALGFPEIQWDYIRFPDAPRSDLDRAVFPGANGRSKARAVRDFLRRSREELADIGVLSTADVFGVTTTSAQDVGIGQVWEAFIDVVDAALPMVYPSHYWRGSFGIQTPNAYPYEIVHRALRDAVRRSDRMEEPGITRPFLQDFTLGQPRYEAPEVRAQIEATYDAGLDEWVLWHPGSRYTEAALEPTGGWPTEPLIRVAGGLHPVSRRHAAMDSVRAAAAGATERQRFVRDSLAAVEDSLRAARDTVAHPNALPLDSVIRVDTLRGPPGAAAPALDLLPGLHPLPGTGRLRDADPLPEPDTIAPADTIPGG